MPSAPVDPRAGSKRPHDSSSGDANSTRDDSSSGGSKCADNEDLDIKIGENVEILNTLYVFKRFIGYQGVVRKMIPRKDQSTPPSCFIEVQRTTTGETVAPGLADEITKLNKNFYTNEEFHLPWVCCRYVVLAEPGLPDPWTPETWARLPLHDRKAHRQKQQQEREEAAINDKRAKTRRRLDMDTDSTHKSPDLAVVPAPPATSAPSKDEPVRHIKYDLAAKPPWSGGEVKPYLYGRKVVFILEGRRGEPINR
jgi:hypothetical protein